MEPPQLGDRVREIVTKKEGVITGYCEYLWGCEQFLVYLDGEKDKEGDPKNVWYDVGRLEILERATVTPIEYVPAVAPTPEEQLERWLEKHSADLPRRPLFRRSARPKAVFAGPDTPAPVR